MLAVELVVAILVRVEPPETREHKAKSSGTRSMLD